MPHHPPTGEELAKIIEQITDRATLDKVESLISEKALSNLVDQLNDARGDAFKNDKRYILDTLLRAPGPVQTKTEFMNFVIEKGAIDGKKIYERTGTVRNLLDMLIKDDRMDKDLFDYLAAEFSGKNGKAKFTLGSSSAVGAGEGLLIFFCKDMGKGSKGDLVFGTIDLEIKANGSRWASATKSPAENMTEIPKGIADELNVTGTTVRKTFIDHVTKGYLDTNVKNKDIVKQISKAGIEPLPYSKAMGKVLKDVYDRGVDVSGFESGKWITATSNNTTLLKKAFSRMLFTFYKDADNWDYLVMFNQTNYKVAAMAKPDDVDKVIDASMARPGGIAMSGLKLGNNGKGSFEMSPVYTLK